MPDLLRHPVFENTDKVVWVVQHVRDITERKKAEKLISDALTFKWLDILSLPLK